MEDYDILLKFQDPASRNLVFNQLVRKYPSKVYWHVRKMMVDHDDADDLTQDVFIKVWKHLSTFRQDAALFTWIYRIATNECLNFLGSKRRRFLLSLTDVGAGLAAQLFRLQHLDYCRYKWLVGLGLLAVLRLSHWGFN